MPELPEVEALVAFLTERAVGQVVARVDVASINVLKTFEPPVSSLQGLEVTGAARYGKFLDLDVSGLHQITHLSRAGWLHWRETLPPAPPVTSRRRRSSGCASMAVPASPAPSAVTPCAKCRSRTRRWTTARPARPEASRSRTGGCRNC